MLKRRDDCTVSVMSKWRRTEPLEGTTLFPHHRRWDCRRAIIGALRTRYAEPSRAREFLGRADAYNSIMFDCGDPLAYRYCVRIAKLRRLLNGQD